MLLVFGSVNADLLFKVPSLPRPSETVLCPGYEVAPGGKGSNQAAAAAKAGGTVRFVGHLGGDAYAPVVRQFLVDAGIDCRDLATSDDQVRMLSHAGCFAVEQSRGLDQDVFHGYLARVIELRHARARAPGGDRCRRRPQAHPRTACPSEPRFTSPSGG